ncbi:MAG: 50S ribosomal protein L11 methyltransferase, partial [Blastocatellia bacterium]
WHVIEIDTEPAGEAAVTAQLWAHNTTGIEFSEANPAFLTLRAYFETVPDTDALRAGIHETLRHEGLPAETLRELKNLSIAEQDWMSEWKKGWQPLPVGDRLLITPTWKLAEVADSPRVIVQIDPGMAFGTGTHETTRGCLTMLERHWAGRGANSALLDVGTGTGILAIAAVKLVPGARVAGFDTDPEAIEVALENAAVNSVADELEIEVNKLSSYAGQDFDVVLANLTADVVIPLAPEFPAVMKPGGALIVSGILLPQETEVTEALGAVGFAVLETRPDGEWITIALRLN